jgi:predicted ATPase
MAVVARRTSAGRLLPVSRISRFRRLEREPFPVPAIRRVAIKNYKSIEACDVTFGAITLLVGPNGAGKSNFLDAIQLTTDALRSTLEYAILERGGISEVRRRSRGHPTHFGIRLDLTLAEDWTATYAYEVAARKGGTFEVQREECRVFEGKDPRAHFSVRKGQLVDESEDGELPPETTSDRLYLQLVSGSPFFRRVFDLLTNLGFYNLNPDAIRELQSPNMGNILLRDGSNLAAVIRRMNSSTPMTAERVKDYLNSVVPGVRGVSTKTLGPKETIEVRQEVSGDPHPWRYLAASLSDGTLRALGVLVAVFQTRPNGHAIPFVAIEEPEMAIHPGAAARLMDALIEATSRTQLLVTTHSPDLLDHKGLGPESIIAVEANRGNSLIGRVDSRTRTALRENLYTVGELLRLEQVAPDLFEVERTAQQLKLFGL